MTPEGGDYFESKSGIEDLRAVVSSPKELGRQLNDGHSKPGEQRSRGDRRQRGRIYWRGVVQNINSERRESRRSENLE